MGRSKAIVLHPQQQQQQPQQRKLSDAVLRPSNIRIRRAILAGKRGPTTPVPSWKLYENPSYDGIIAGNDEASGRQITISARKLAATLWELQELPLCKAPRGAATTTSAKGSSTRLPPRSSRGPRQREASGSPEPLMLPPPSPATPVPQSYLKPTSTKSSDSHRRSPYSDSNTYHSRRASEEMISETPPRESFEAERRSSEEKAEGRAELLKVLSNISNQGGSTAVLRVELEHTRQRVRELEVANKSARRDIEALVERAESERASWRAKEQEKSRAAILAAKQEAEEERRLRRRAELASRKLEAELEEVNIELARAIKELERERKARQLMEDVCDELAREIGHDKAEVEQLKRESEQVREEVEEERRMLQMAEVWREERVQMKLAEARHELEDKNATLDRLRAELEEFLHAKASATVLPSGVQKGEQLRAAVDSLRKRNEEGGTSAEEDLHSIDLNKESLFDRTQGNRWTINRGQNGAWTNEKKAPIEFRRKVFKGRRRARKQRVYDETIAGADDQQEQDEEGEEKQRCGNGNELENGPNEGYHHRGAARRIDTIPEQQEELYHNSSSPKEEEDEQDFALGFAQREGGNCRTPSLSPLLHSSASFPLSSGATPQRNSWSSGDLNPRGGSMEWPRVGGRGARDNSLRAKLLEAQLEDPHVYHHRSKRDK